MKLVRWTFFTLIAIVAAYMGWRLIYGYWSERSGPFVYFQNAPGEGSVQERGERQIAAKLRIGADAAEAERLLTDAGFECVKDDNPLPTLYILNPATKQLEALPKSKQEPRASSHFIMGCIWRFGFADNWWHSSFTSDENGHITRSFHGITDGPDV